MSRSLRGLDLSIKSTFVYMYIHLSHSLLLLSRGLAYREIPDKSISEVKRACVAFVCLMRYRANVIFFFLEKIKTSYYYYYYYYYCYYYKTKESLMCDDELTWT